MAYEKNINPPKFDSPLAQELYDSGYEPKSLGDSEIAQVFREGVRAMVASRAIIKRLLNRLE